MRKQTGRNCGPAASTQQTFLNRSIDDQVEVHMDIPSPTDTCEHNLRSGSTLQESRLRILIIILHTIRSESLLERVSALGTSGNPSLDTTNVSQIIRYDTLHVNAWLAWISGTTPVNSEIQEKLTGVTTLFGGNFQAVSVAQKSYGYAARSLAFTPQLIALSASLTLPSARLSLL